MTDQSSAQALPVPVIDHVVINVRDEMPQAAAIFARLGFALTPPGRHTLGSINHLAMFGPDYLELWGIPAGDKDQTGVMDWPTGLNAVVFATEAADQLHAGLRAAGVQVLPPLAFSRPVDTPQGPQDATFRVVRLAPQTSPAGRLFFCQHLTRAAVWQDRWRRHPNGVTGIAGVVTAAEAPDELGGLFRRMFGDGAVVPVAGGVRLLAGLSSIDVVGRAEVARRYGAVAPPSNGRTAQMVALRLRVGSLDAAAAALRDGGINTTVSPGRVMVSALGTVLDFCTDA